MTGADRNLVIFDLGGVLIDWDPRHLYRKLFTGDDAAMEHFLATVCTHEWNRCQDAGRSFTEGARLLKVEHPDKAELIDAYGNRFDEMMAGPIAGSVRSWPSSVIAAPRLCPHQLVSRNLSGGLATLCVSKLVPGNSGFRRGRGDQAGPAHL